MANNTKFILRFFYIKSVVLFLSFFILQVKSETKIIAKSGDTLFRLSKQYGVSLKELMHKNNFNDAKKILEGEVIIIPLKTNDDNNNRLIYKVIKGDTLYKIARDYNVNIKDIISINNLKNNSYLKLDQLILLPKGAIYKKLNSKQKIRLASKKVFYHKTSKTERLLTIADILNFFS